MPDVYGNVCQSVKVMNISCIIFPFVYVDDAKSSIVYVRTSAFNRDHFIFV